MKVQSKILLLLFAIVAIFVGGLATLKHFEQAKFKAIADERSADRHKDFSKFLEVRGDKLKALVDDWTNFTELVGAIVKDDRQWVADNLNDSRLATANANAVWIYRNDLSLFASHHNRQPLDLQTFPISPEALKQLTGGTNECHFFVKAPPGWMEIRGGTIHQSDDRYRETKPQGWLFAGHSWIDTNIDQMAMFTGYDIDIVSFDESRVQPANDEQHGLIAFSRTLPGWDGKPVAQIEVRHFSKIISELNESSRRLFSGLMIFAAVLFLVLAVSLSRWVRRPLRLIAKNLEQGSPEALEPLKSRPDEFGKLAQLILQYRRTEEILHKTEDQLRHSQKLEAVGRLAGGVAHDFNNLLTAIIGYSEMLEAKLVDDDPSREQAHLIRKAGEQAASLTRQLLAFSRKQLLQPKVLDLNDLIREMEKLLQRVIGEHIRIHIEPAAADPRVLADPNQLEQVILNLGVNARDAMPRGGTLTITTSNISLPGPGLDGAQTDLAPGEYVSLEVHDTGLGMDAETKARIFEPFFTTKGPGKGTGLGLATVYGIVKQSGGGIDVESTPGEGSTFRVCLPRENQPVAVRAELPPVTGSAAGETILVVEDEEVVRQLLCTVLGDLGYQVLCASTPREALDLVKANGPKIDLLVSDVVMPEMHGPVLARALSEIQPQMKILYVSGYSENDISDQGVIEAGLKVLQKPFTQQSLVRKVREMLDETPPDS
jgi:signal transduction histidine kinase/ActR/RegA family two-component response regulator